MFFSYRLLILTFLGVKKMKTVVAKPIVEVNQRQMVDLLFAQNNTSFIGFDSTTEPQMRKTNNRFFGLVEKNSTVSALGWYQYSRMVDNAQKRQLSAELKTTLEENGVPMSVINGYFILLQTS